MILPSTLLTTVTQLKDNAYDINVLKIQIWRDPHPRQKYWVYVWNQRFGLPPALAYVLSEFTSVEQFVKTEYIKAILFQRPERFRSKDSRNFEVL